MNDPKYVSHKIYFQSFCWPSDSTLQELGCLCCEVLTVSLSTLKLFRIWFSLFSSLVPGPIYMPRVSSFSIYPSFYPLQIPSPLWYFHQSRIRTLLILRFQWFFVSLSCLLEDHHLPFLPLNICTVLVPSLFKIIDFSITLELTQSHHFHKSENSGYLEPK